MNRRPVFLLVLATAAIGALIWWLARGGPAALLERQRAAMQAAPAAQAAGDNTPSTLPVVPAPAPTAEAPRLPPPAPPKPRARAGKEGLGAAAGDPAVIDRALATHSQAELALLGQLARSGVALPAQVEELFQRRRQGASPEEQRRFVRAHFPRDMRMRLMTIRWINRLDPARAHSGPPLAPTTGQPLPPLGSIERTDRPAPRK